MNKLCLLRWLIYQIRGYGRDYCVLVFFPLFYFGYCSQSAAQSNSDFQIWNDVELNYTYKQKYLFQNELSYQTLVSGGTRWYSFNSTPAFEYNLNPNFDLLSAIPLSYTYQKAGMNTFEIRAMLGTRVYFTPTRRVQPRLLLRFEERWAHDASSGKWDIGNRFRIRGEFIYPLNKSTYFQDNMWYSITDAEVFLFTNKDISERFANRMRFRAGIGYRLSYKFRFEAIYICQLSRNTTDEDFDSQSNILRLRLKYYFQ